MNFSWGGFARTLNDNIIKNQDMQREESSYARRKKMEMELEKQYGAEVVARTAIENGYEINYNKFGDKIGTPRQLTPEELAVYRAPGRKSIADADLSEFNVTKAPEAWELDRRATEQQIRASESSMANDAIRTRNDTTRANREGLDGVGLPKNLAEDYYKLVGAIEMLEPDGISSPDSRIESVAATIDGMRAKNDVRGIATFLAREQARVAKEIAAQEAKQKYRLPAPGAQ